MKIMRTRFGCWRLAACAAFGGAMLFLAASCAWGQGAEGISVPLYAGNAVPLQDEFGRPMRGSPAAAAAANRPRVEVRYAYTNRNPLGEVFAPGLNGEASPYHPPVAADAQVGQALFPPLAYLLILAGQGVVAGFGQFLEPRVALGMEEGLHDLLAFTGTGQEELAEVALRQEDDLAELVGLEAQQPFDGSRHVLGGDKLFLGPVFVRFI